MPLQKSDCDNIIFIFLQIEDASKQERICFMLRILKLTLLILEITAFFPSKAMSEESFYLQVKAQREAATPEDSALATDELLSLDRAKLTKGTDNLNVVMDLIKRGAQLNVRQKCFNMTEKVLPFNMTPLHLAFEKNNINAAKLLIKLKADVTLEGFRGTDVLKRALTSSSNKTIDFVKLFLDNGALIDAKDLDGRTPLECTVLSSENIRSMPGGYPNRPPVDSYQLRFQLTRILLDANADFTIKNRKGLTPEESAKKNYPYHSKIFADLFDEKRKQIQHTYSTEISALLYDNYLREEKALPVLIAGYAEPDLKECVVTLTKDFNKTGATP